MAIILTISFVVHCSADYNKVCCNSGHWEASHKKLLDGVSSEDERTSRGIARVAAKLIAVGLGYSREIAYIGV